MVQLVREKNLDAAEAVIRGRWEVFDATVQRLTATRATDEPNNSLYATQRLLLVTNNK